jgi:hypothetical protein
MAGICDRRFDRAETNGRTASRVVGSGLTIQDFADLDARWIDRRLALQTGLRRVDSLTGAEIIGRKSGNHAGIVIPYFHPGSDQVRVSIAQGPP